MSRRWIGQETFSFAAVGRGSGSSLDKLSGLIEWAPVERALAGISNAAKGEPAWPSLALFKATLLSVWYDLSDVKLAEALDDRPSLRRFCGFSPSEPTPERTAFVRFRKALVEQELDRVLFEEVTAQLKSKASSDAMAWTCQSRRTGSSHRHRLQSQTHTQHCRNCGVKPKTPPQERGMTPGNLGSSILQMLGVVVHNDPRTGLLHTWGSAMTHHPHVHMIVPGGGIALGGSRWISSRPAFLLPVRVLGKLFRRPFLTRLVALHDAGRLSFFGTLAHLTERRAFLHHLAPVREKRWVVYAKPPFAGPEAVLAYLSRYTHRVAISNSRLITFDETGVIFRYKDYRRDGTDRQQIMRLAADEFIRRFLLHFLPRGFHRIRHYGLLTGSARKASLALARELLDVAAPPDPRNSDEPEGFRPPCRCCGGRMIIIETFERWRQPRGPPNATATNREGWP